MSSFLQGEACYYCFVNNWAVLTGERYKYTYMEEMLGNPAGCRQVFERWMEWEPEEQAWHSYINFELRYKEVDKARSIYERYILLGTCMCGAWRCGKPTSERIRAP